MTPQPLQPAPFTRLRARANGMSAMDWSWLATLSLLWGSGTFFNVVAVQDVAPLTVVFCRVALAAIVVGLVVRIRGVGLLPGRKEVVPFLVLGVVNTAVPYSLIAWGAQRLDSGVAGMLLATTPMFTVLIAHVATGDEHLGISTLSGIGLSLAGVLMLLGGHPLALAGGGFAALALLGAALSYGVACVFGRTLREIPPLKLAWGQLAVATLLMLPLLALPGAAGDFRHWSWPAIGAVAALALLSTAARSLAYFHVLARVGSTNTSLVGFLIPVSSLAVGVLVLGEPLGLAHLAGLGAVLAGLAVVDGRFPAARPSWTWRPARKPRSRQGQLADPRGHRASAGYDESPRQAIP